jgi:hypothetical protein
MVKLTFDYILSLSHSVTKNYCFAPLRKNNVKFSYGFFDHKIYLISFGKSYINLICCFSE